MSNYSVQIADVPDKEKLVAEIWQDDIMIAELNQENDLLQLEIYNCNNKVLTLDYNRFVWALSTAKELLVGKEEIE